MNILEHKEFAGPAVLGLGETDALAGNQDLETGQVEAVDSGYFAYVLASEKFSSLHLDWMGVGL